MNHINNIFLKLGFKLGFPPEFRVMVYTYGNDPEIFSISIIEKVSEFRKDFLPLTGNFRNIPEYCSGKIRFTEKSFQNFLEKRYRHFKLM